LSITEFSFSVNEFKEPKVYEDAEATAVLLARLILLEPGTIQSHPDMGVGIESRYRFSIDRGCDELRIDIQQQITKYLPQFQNVEVKVTEVNRQYRITATIDDTLYGILYDRDTGTTKYSYTSLDNL
jgi:hypothetical protein